MFTLQQHLYPGNIIIKNIQSLHEFKDEISDCRKPPGYGTIPYN